MFKKLKKLYKRLTRKKNPGFDYYQKLHDKSKSYQNNNWLIDQTVLIDYLAGKTFAELGCGNCQFISRVAPHAEKAYGIDWAKSEGAASVPANVTFLQGNALTIEFPVVDVFCSGDVLEHFSPADISTILHKLHESARYNYHVIACFDDNHSHLIVQPKEWWLAEFKKLSSDYRILNLGTELRDVAIISNIPFDRQI